MTGYFVFFAALIACGAVFCFVHDQLDRRWFLRHGQRVLGEVVRVKVTRSTTWSGTADGGSMPNTTRRYTPTVRFTTMDGQVVQTRTRSTQWRRVRAGDQVQVAYDPAKPGRARIM